jgi:hypothetical protein
MLNVRYSYHLLTLILICISNSSNVSFSGADLNKNEVTLAIYAPVFSYWIGAQQKCI